MDNVLSVNKTRITVTADISDIKVPTVSDIKVPTVSGITVTDINVGSDTVKGNGALDLENLSFGKTDVNVSVSTGEELYVKGIKYEKASHVAEDPKKASDYRKEAFNCYQQAAELGHPEACLTLYFAYDEVLPGKLGVEPNIDEAIKWLKKAADKGIIHAQFSLALRYEKGDGVKLNYKEAFNLYKKVTEHMIVQSGNSIKDQMRKENDTNDKMGAYCRMAHMYSVGNGVEPSYKESFNCYMEAARLGSKEGFLGLSKAYAYGWGVEQDYAKADLWHKAWETGIYPSKISEVYQYVK